MVMEPVVSVEWLAEHLEDPDVRVFDASINADRVLGLPRIRNGRRDYDRAHPRQRLRRPARSAGPDRLSSDPHVRACSVAFR
jgi:hypothetical protein